MAPWGNRPRYRVWWASDTFWTGIAAAVVIAIYLIWEAFGEAPQGLITLVGLAGGTLFGVASGDKKKRDRDTERTAERAEETANRAETKADRLVAVAETEHPEVTRSTGLPEPEKPTDGGPK